tara:strand:- start:1720 stop:3423 length:1704 start_codon:yes stop_codon:yes gene_type:complete
MLIIEFITIFLFPFLISFQILLFGYGTKKIIFNEKFLYKSKNIYILVGLAIYGNLLLLINFVSPLDKYITTTIYFIPFLFLYFVKITDVKKLFIYSIKFSVFFALLISYDNINRPDAGLYHYPYINILNNEKIIIGLANLHFRFGHTSIIQFISAGYNNFVFSDKGTLIPIALIFFSVCNYFYNELKSNLSQNKLLYYLSFFLLIQILYDMNRYSGYGNDVPGHLLFLFCCYYLIKNKFLDYRSFFIISSLCIFTFQNKSTLGLILIIPIFLIFFYNKFNYLFKISNLILISMISFWFIKNILISGCLLFPKESTCIKSLYWNSSLIYNVNSAEKVSVENEARSKDHPNRVDRKLNYTDFLESNWRPTWINGHGKKVVLKKILPIIILLIAVSIYVRIFQRKLNYNNFNKQEENKNISILIFSLLGVLVWFENFPTYRYGSSYIIFFIISLSAFINRKHFSQINKILNHKLIYFFIFVLIIKFSLKYNPNQNLWPNIYDYNSKNLIPPKVKNIKVNNEIGYYTTVNGKVCMSNLAPCTNLVVHESIDVKKENNYKVFFLNSTRLSLK